MLAVGECHAALATENKFNILPYTSFLPPPHFHKKIIFHVKTNDAQPPCSDIDYITEYSRFSASRDYVCVHLSYEAFSGGGGAVRSLNKHGRSCTPRFDYE